jgi:hypothetical protein
MVGPGLNVVSPQPRSRGKILEPRDLTLHPLPADPSPRPRPGGPSPRPRSRFILLPRSSPRPLPLPLLLRPSCALPRSPARPRILNSRLRTVWLELMISLLSPSLLSRSLMLTCSTFLVHVSQIYFASKPARSKTPSIH